MTPSPLPTSLLARAVDLTPLGIDELAWSVPDALEVLGHLGNGVSVLGGDVYVRRSVRYEPAHENWHSEPRPGEPPDAFATRSRAEARAYLGRLRMRGSPEHHVTLVLEPPLRPKD